MTRISSLFLRAKKNILPAVCLGIGLSTLLSGCGGGGVGGGSGSNNPAAPTVTSISPTSVAAGAAAFTLTVNGTGFTASTVIEVNGTADTTTFVSASQVTAAVTASQVASGGNLNVVAVNGSQTSQPGTVTLQVKNPAPTISSVAPASIVAGTASPVVTVTGTGFVSTTVVNVNGSARTTTYASATQVSVALTAADVTSAGSLSLTAVNPAPGGGTSAAQSVTVIAPNPVPTIASLSPTVETVGATSPVVTVTGTGFVSTTVINVNGSARPTTVASATEVSVTLSAADVASTGTLSLTATNPAPGGGTSATTSLAVNNPTVGTIQLSPAVLTAGSTSSATITVTGNTFVSASVVSVNGTPRATTFVNSTNLTFVATVADQATAATLSVTVTNPSPGGGTSPVARLTISSPTSTPVITSVAPNTFYAGSGDTTIAVSGTGLTSTSVVQWNGTNLTTSSFVWGQMYATVPAADLTTAGTASVTVSTPTANPAVSNALTVTISNPPVPTVTAIYPASGAVNSAASLRVTGTGFMSSSTVTLNGVKATTSYVSPTQLNADIAASTLALPGNYDVAVVTPAPGGGTSSAVEYTAYLNIAANDIVYNPTDALLYASVATSQGSISGNSVVGIDPTTGSVQRTIWVGSKPNKLALSSDGTQLFVGLDGAGAVAQVDMVQGKVVNQFSLGGGSGVYNPPNTANFLAAVPGQPNSVAVSAANGWSGSDVTIYDSGVARAKNSSSFSTGAGPICFGASASTLYLWSSGLQALTIDSTGVTAASTLNTSVSYYYGGNIQYDNGRIYLSNGTVFDASSGAQLGTFYSSATSAATGPIVSDSSLGRAFIASNGYSSSGQVFAFDESTFNPVGSFTVSGTSGYSGNFNKIARWGQSGLAVNSGAQIFLFQSPLVKDLSSSPADLSVTLTAPSTGATGTALSYVATVKNAGPNQAQGATLALTLDSSLIVNSVTASQGSCSQGSSIVCDLGSVASGSQATVTVSATPTDAGTLAGAAVVDSTSYDPATTNNQASSSTTVTGNVYGMVPSITALSPALVEAGSSDFTLTVTGTGFNADSTIYLGSTALATTFVSATQLTASVTASQIANYGWAPVTVTNPAPGGGTSQVSSLTIYTLVNVPANQLVFDPFSQQLYATVPSASTTVTGNSVVAVDPVTAKAGTPVLVGSEPNPLAETSDGNYLWIGLTGSKSLVQFDLFQQKVTATVPLNLTQYGSTTSMTATWIAAMPGSDTTMAVDINNGWGNFGIVDVSGSTATFRPNLSGIYDGVDPVFADATHLYAYDSQTSGAEFYRYTVDSNGLTLVDGTTLNGMGGFAGSFHLANGLVYGGAGGIADPRTTPPQQIAVLSPIDFYQSGIGDYGVTSVPDPSTNKEFMMIENTAGTWAYALARYDTTRYLPETWLPMPSSLNNILTGWTMLRWGQDGLALLASVNNNINSQGSTQIMLLRGPFVTPQLLGSNTAATLTSSSAATIAHGSGNTMLTLTGSNFAPGVAVTWNGSYRTTTIVDSTHVTIAIPASDLAAAGTASVVATNPGGPASNALTITIN